MPYVLGEGRYNNLINTYYQQGSNTSHRAKPKL